MVARAGRGWVLPPALIALEDEVNRRHPLRSKRSDGSIGDQAHASRTSDHNPAGGFVTAIDLTHDPRNGFDAHAHARDLARRGDSRLKYLISAGEFWKPGKGWRPYAGINSHHAHAHYSILNIAAARGNTSSWFSSAPLRPHVPDWAALRRGVAGYLAGLMAQQPNLDANSPASLSVVVLQQSINHATGSRVPENGRYSPETMQAVANFQAYMNGIRPGAIRDPNGAAMEGTRWLLVVALQRIAAGLA